MTGVDDISSNVHKLVGVTAGMNTAASTGPMNLVLDKCSVVLEELRTIQILTETHSEGLSEQLKMTEKNILEMENLFDQIDQLCLFVQKAKSDLDKLEKLYNVVDRQ
ncbi:Biogenesis of lysosome-related organelles complex 1 subunit 4 [Caenorhabditis elegans]|uniref:Biogenesis of lysosome-related organelles complex 1 subunit 4 n=1 Tax=Caenorhabditis elegans TaxID=6239 RepID=BL1S4_CAEEL|nr:Biogenesis of lysosome-related organelles complex 1 subunit 4 [Caenorhabditis elegans]Q22756.1 RecName: Full=Biogenesis of lysosome-related organelles complex 1 subunit 4; Short=BLOC-1 subunit 4; AltName: Full=Protein cappuccino homolog [Caenorhabditis elegans]CCD66145.1 Biogenesis of lysosome-related organelles complex 1 subunit 4 [Caenorhabditis elegans]|eukprot:NP_495247.1 Biogenesis of lysosome-related organelles complex 1 subunit 4 [Caenorhabditis elegans]